MEWKVSVIIPVFNSAQFLKMAVDSCALLDEVGEVLLIDDGSTDNSFFTCLDLQKKYEKLEVLKHIDGKNHGVSATRNLGIKNSRFDFVAFLDSDDYYLPTRFRKAKQLCMLDHTVDGVYDAAQYDDDYAVGNKKLYSITEPIKPSDLFYFLLTGQKGFFCTNTITIKKSLFERAGMFLESTRMHEDTELWLRLAFYGRLVAGELNKPVAVINRHATNAIYGRNQQTLEKLGGTLIGYYSDKDLSHLQRRALLESYWRSRSLRFKNNLLRRMFYYLNFTTDFFKLVLKIKK